MAVLKQADLGMPVAGLIRQVGISEQTFYRWKAVAAQFSATMQAFQTFNRQSTITTCNRLGYSISCYTC